MNLDPVEDRVRTELSNMNSEMMGSQTFSPGLTPGQMCGWLAGTTSSHFMPLRSQRLDHALVYKPKSSSAICNVSFLLQEARQVPGVKAIPYVYCILYLHFHKAHPLPLAGASFGPPPCNLPTGLFASHILLIISLAYCAPFQTLVPGPGLVVPTLGFALVRFPVYANAAARTLVS